jgi:hypothetical protein
MYDLPDGQPKLPVTQHDVPGASKLVLTYNAPFIDLRAYDADFNFKRQHAIFRMSGLFTDIFRYLRGNVFLRLLTPLFERVIWSLEYVASIGLSRSTLWTAQNGPTLLNSVLSVSILAYLSAIYLKRLNCSLFRNYLKRFNMGGFEAQNAGNGGVTPYPAKTLEQLNFCANPKPAVRNLAMKLARHAVQLPRASKR